MTRLRLLFAGTVFLGSFLLFLVEPIAARELLPVLGGSAAVWITCLVFFQTQLLLGYLYAHWLSRHPRWTAHLGLLALAAAAAILWVFRTIAPGGGAVHPVLTVFDALGVWIGLPFLMLSATSPLLQVWWARLETGQIPYRLYALSNLASLLALGLYPTVIEPHLTLHTQRLTWCCGFALFAIFSAILAVKTRSAASPQSLTVDDSSVAPAPLTHKILWVLLPMGAAMQLSAVTSYLTANVAAIPLLWILPSQRLSPHPHCCLPVSFPVALGHHRPVHGGPARQPRLLIVPSQIPLATVALAPVLSGRIVLCRPLLPCRGLQAAPRTRIGVHTFLSPLRRRRRPRLFPGRHCRPAGVHLNLDLPITFLVTALLALAVNWNAGLEPAHAMDPSPAAPWWCSSSWSASPTSAMTTVAVRNFYASLRVNQSVSYPGTTKRTLMNGIIQHGTQIFGYDEMRKTPTTYYSRDSGVGLALQILLLRARIRTNAPPRRIGVIGLGAGTIAAYGRPGDRIRFYEINPAVPPIARNVFTYIRESGAQVDIVVGDARTSLAGEEPQQFDVLVIDAFSGDAIPIHLLTREALALYRRHLAPSGILAFHISNRHVNLEPAIALLAASAGMEARHVNSMAKDDPGAYSATWMLVTDNASFFLQPELVAHAFFPDTKPGLRVWTDDYSALLPVLRW